MSNNRDTYSYISEFLSKYSSTVAWRVKSHCKVIDSHLNANEKLLYAFCGQKNDEVWNMLTSCVVAITDRRIMIGMKRLVYGYFFWSITPDMFNDLDVYSGLIFGKITIDTIKENIVISNLDKRSLPEIESSITEYVMRSKSTHENTSIS